MKSKRHGFTNLPLPRQIAHVLAALPHKEFKDYGMEDIAPAGIVLTEKGSHELVIGESFWDKTKEQQTFILLHEFTHLAFGHCLTAKRLSLNPIGWNICTDAWINEVHPHHLTQGLGGILYSELRGGMPAKPPTAQCPQGVPAREPIPELPPWLLDPLSIYRLLKDKAEKQWNQMDSMVIQGDGKIDEGQAGLEVLRARKALRDAALDDPQYQRLVDELSHSFQGSRGIYTEVKVADWLEGIYKQLDKLASQRQGDLVRRRGWRRPGRLPGLAGTARRPSLHVMIALDVSGSTGAWWGDMIAACRGITRYHEVNIVCHSDNIVYQGKAIPVDAPVGGGTLFKPVCQAAKQMHPDCIIWVTDGESGDKPRLPDCPIYWVWLPGSAKWKLRDGDHEVNYGN